MVKGMLFRLFTMRSILRRFFLCYIIPMELRKIALLACFVVSCAIVRADDAAPPPVDRSEAESLVSSWMDIKASLMGSPELVAPGTQQSLVEFGQQIALFRTNPLFSLAAAYCPGLDANVIELQQEVKMLSVLLIGGRVSHDALLKIGEIDSHMLFILECKYHFVKSINRKYINVMFLFITIFAFIILMVLMNRRHTKSAERSEAYVTAYARSVVRAHEAERKKLARELHDTIVQDVTGMKLKTEALYYSITKDTKQYDAAFNSLISNEQSCIESIRSVCYELRPPELDYLDLTAAVSELCSHFSASSGISCKFESSGDFKLSGDEETNVFRIIQESLSNVGKHSGATESLVSLAFDGKSTLSVSIRDNGSGFDTGVLDLSKEVPPRNFGLKGIRERVDILEGILEIDSVPGDGTNILVTIPLTVS